MSANEGNRRIVSGGVGLATSELKRTLKMAMERVEGVAGDVSSLSGVTIGATQESCSVLHFPLKSTGGDFRSVRARVRLEPAEK